MNKLIIYILAQGFEDAQFTVDGQSGTNYAFLWNRERSRYEYTPKDKEEAEDLFLSQSINSLFYFSAELVAGDGATLAGGSASVPKPALERQYYGDLDQDELVANCRELGIPAHAETSRDELLARLDAYWLGAGYKAVRGAPKNPSAGAKPAETRAPEVDVEFGADLPADPAKGPSTREVKTQPAKPEKPKRAAKPKGMAKAAALVTA